MRAYKALLTSLLFVAATLFPSIAHAQQGTRNLTNKSGGSVTQYMVVVADTTNTKAFTTTTTADADKVLGIVGDATITANSLGVILPLGNVYRVQTVGVVAIGDYLATSTTAGKAESNGSTKTGAFGIALSAGTNATIDVWLFPPLQYGGTSSVTFADNAKANFGTALDYALMYSSVNNRFEFLDAAGNVLTHLTDAGTTGTLVVNGVTKALKSGTAVSLFSTTAFSAQNNTTTTTDCYVSIISGNAATSRLLFGDTDAEGSGQIVYTHGTSMGFYIEGNLGLTLATGPAATFAGTLATSGAVTITSNTNPVFTTISASGTESGIRIQTVSPGKPYIEFRFSGDSSTWNIWRDSSNILNFAFGSRNTSPFLAISSTGNSIGQVVSIAGSTTFKTINTNTGTGAFATVQAGNADAATDVMELIATGTAYTTTGGFKQDAGILASSTQLSGGMSIIARGTTSDVRVYAGGSADADLVITFNDDQTISLVEAANFILGTTTGTKIGTATSQKLGFWNVTPIIQPASANQAALSLDVDVTGADTVDKAAINTNFTNIQTLVNQLRADLVAAGLIKGAA